MYNCLSHDWKSFYESRPKCRSDSYMTNINSKINNDDKNDLLKSRTTLFLVSEALKKIYLLENTTELKSGILKVLDILTRFQNERK